MSSGRFANAAAIVVLAAFIIGCGGDPAPGDTGGATSESAAAAAAADTLADFSAADLDAYTRGITREMELVRAARRAYDTASTPDSRGRLMSAQWESSTIPLGARAAGLETARYMAVRVAVHSTMRMLDYQGRIDGPTSFDTSRADSVMRSRIAGDPYSELPQGAAGVLRAREAHVAQLWGDYVRLTAVAG